ncbi:putative cytochrome P450 monooxygenase [Xylariaceae sp. FL0255]|nr:putative cytochrome P450 monooxygenase [Xylariaceae sp. FL0255]
MAVLGETVTQSLRNVKWVAPVILFVAYWQSSFWISILNQALSRFIHIILVLKYPTRSIEGTSSIPTCPYKFPNGQGDVEKFLQGKQNSEAWRIQHGSVYRIWSGTRPEIVLTTPEHLRAVFHDSDHHTKALNNNSGYVMSELLGNCVGLISGNTWRTVRSSVDWAFHRKSIKDHLPIILKHTSAQFDDLARDEHSGVRLLDPAESFQMLPFWVVAEILYGDLDKQMIDELRELTTIRQQIFAQMIHGGISRFSLSRFLPIPVIRQLESFKKRWKSFNDGVAARLETPAAGRSETPVTHMYQQARKGKVTPQQLLQTLDECLFANLDVTTGAIAWNVIFLAANSEYQEKLAREMEMRGRSEDEIRLYMLDDRTLLAACISESARLRPAAPFSIPQSAPGPREIDGYVIPAGTDFIIDTQSVNVCSAFWGEDGAIYRPERFLEKSSRDQRYQFWRFGFGPRQCLGKYLADLIIRCLIIQLLEKYELALQNDSNDWRQNPTVWISHPQMEVRCIQRRKEP